MAVGKEDYKDSQVREKRRIKVPKVTLAKVELDNDDKRTRAELLDSIEELFQNTYHAGRKLKYDKDVDLDSLKAILTMLVLSAANNSDDIIGATQAQVDAINLNASNIARNASDLATFISNISISNNKVGIGTTSPSFKLDVKTSSSDDGISLSATSGRKAIEMLMDNGTNGGGDIKMYTGTSVLTNRINAQGSSYINGGNVGIGTTNPTRLLHVEGNVAYSTGGWAVGTTATQVGKLFNDAGVMTLRAESSRQIAFGNVNGGEAMRIDAAGNVGIGTTSPSSTLDIKGTTTDNSAKAISAQNSNGAELFYVRNDGVVSVSNGYLYAQHSSGAYFEGSIKARGGITDDGGTLGLGASGDTSQLNIVGGGNVGIGTATPSEKLEVNGNVQASSYKISGVTVLSGSANVSLGSSGATGTISLNTHTSTALYVAGDDNVGIGTTSPHNKAHITSSGNQDGLLLDLSTGSSGDYTGVYFKVDNNTTNAYKKGGLVWERTGSYNEGRFHFLLNNEDNTNNVDLTDSKFTILSTGNVGIGTTGPTELFEVYKNGGDVAIKVHEDAGTHEAKIHLRRGGSDWELINNNDLAIESEGTELFRIKTSGNVGIGTTSPSASLHIAADSPVIRLQDNTSSDNHYLTGNNGEFRIQTTGFLTLRPGNTESVRFLANGNVGIGTSSPSEKLEVSGKILATGGQIRAGSYLESYPSFSFADDIDTGMFSDTANQLEFVTGGSSRVTINSSGNVGIGTTSPSELLTIAAESPTLRFEDISSSNYTEMYVNNFDTYLNTNGRFFIQNQGSTKVTFKSDGNVGIGTTSPSEKLEVTGNIKVSGNLDIGGSVQKQIQVFPMNFVDDLGTDKHFMPFVTANEQTVNYQEEAAMVMPADGRVVSVTVHYAQMHGAASDITVGIETSPCGQSYTNTWTIEETETISASADDDHHVFHFAFDNAKHFESTDKMALSIQQSVDLQNANRFFWVTAVIEYDWSTFLGGTSAEYGTTP